MKNEDIKDGPGSKVWEEHKLLVQRRVQAMKTRGSVAEKIRVLEAVKLVEDLSKKKDSP